MSNGQGGFHAVCGTKVVLSEAAKRTIVTAESDRFGRLHISGRKAAATIHRQHTRMPIGVNG
jgi:hypothetical protein